ncbi:hypothetical protein EVAR_29268_1 [Eumeta japonica]|uniref:Uncharacterized protein n=1 Tax=Eumeta variegata TaxID=151549 RepID=A0A4C1VXB0_EUMVA|nr:hypothetical protein EVAR_29268_1 [Eumeta japonica]
MSWKISVKEEGQRTRKPAEYFSNEILREIAKPLTELVNEITKKSKNIDVHVKYGRLVMQLALVKTGNKTEKKYKVNNTTLKLMEKRKNLLVISFRKENIEVITELISSDRVDCIGPTYGSELKNKYENKKTFSPAQGTVALQTGLTDEGRGENGDLFGRFGCRTGAHVGQLCGYWISVWLEPYTNIKGMKNKELEVELFMDSANIDILCVTELLFRNDPHIVRPCPHLEVDCIRHQFLASGLCSSPVGKVPDPIRLPYRDVYLPNVNGSIFMEDMLLRGMNGDIVEFYINQKTDRAVLAFRLIDFQIETKRAHMTYLPPAREPVTAVTAITEKGGTGLITVVFEGTQPLNLRHSLAHSVLEVLPKITIGTEPLAVKEMTVLGVTQVFSGVQPVHE